MERYSSTQDRLLLSDVPQDPELAYVDALVSVELGTAMRLSIFKMDASSFDVLVPDAVTLRGLKAAISKKIDEMEEQELGHRHQAFLPCQCLLKTLLRKHVWANFCLCHGDLNLVGESTVLRDAGVKDRDQIRFEAHREDAGRHSRAKRRRMWRS